MHNTNYAIFTENNKIKLVFKDILITLIRYAQGQWTEKSNDSSVSYNRKKVKKGYHVFQSMQSLQKTNHVDFNML